MRVASLENREVLGVTRSLRDLHGVRGVEIDVFSRWIVVRGEGLAETALLRVLSAAGLLVERVSHDAPGES